MMKDKQIIDRLLARFMAGQTTESEEQMLKDYFCSLDMVPDEWQPYAIMFKGFGKKKSEQKMPTTKPRNKAIVGWIASAAIVAIAAVILAISNDEAPDVQTAKNTTAEHQPPVTDDDANQRLALNDPEETSAKESDKNTEHNIAPAKEAFDNNQSAQDRLMAVESETHSAEELLANEPGAIEADNANELLAETAETERNTPLSEEEYFMQQYYISCNNLRNAMEESATRRAQLRTLFIETKKHATYKL